MDNIRDKTDHSEPQVYLESVFREKRTCTIKLQVREPDQMIRGGPSIKTYSILNDKRHIVAKDTDGQVAVFDVLKAAKVEDCGNADYDQIVKDRQQV